MSSRCEMRKSDLQVDELAELADAVAERALNVYS